MHPTSATQDWAHLGRVIRRDRKLKGLSQKDLAVAAGVSLRTVGHYEQGRVPVSAPAIPGGYDLIGALLGWPANGVERALGGGEPAGMPDGDVPGHEVSPGDLYPAVLLFARACMRNGGDPRIRARFEDDAERLLRSTVTTAPGSGKSDSYALAAFRPHAVGEGIPEDDQERIRRALDELDS